MTRAARRKKLRKQAMVGAFVASTAFTTRPVQARDLADLLRHSRTLQAAQVAQASARV
jgi:hypothetical protein